MSKHWNTDIRQGGSEFLASVIRQCGVDDEVFKIVEQVTAITERAELMAALRKDRQAAERARPEARVDRHKDRSTDITEGG